MKATFSSVALKGIATFVPEQSIDIDSELHTLYHGDEKALKRIKKVIGLQKRHIAPPNLTASDMAEMAAISLIESLNLDRSRIDALIFVTQTPDYILPASACYLHGRLGLSSSCFSFDINQACAGYLYGLYMAHSLISSGGAKCVLLLCGDTISKFVNPLDSSLAPVIGDGVSATLLEYTPSHEKAFLELGSLGEKFYQLIIPEGAGRIPTKDIIADEKVWQTSESRTLKNLYMDGAEIFNFAVMTYPKTFEEIIAYAKKQKEDFEYYFFHQANKYIVDNIIRRLGLDKAKVPNDTTNKYGNLSGCSIPATICDRLDSIHSPLRSDMQIFMAGFGAGLSWGNAILTLPQDFICQKVQFAPSH
ncbi:beta-ketoacyl-ACP synthase III [Helicobacter didelphidarum]|uniref:Beta-ketoacyl-ACP synthase III n=1 Tax=Helicobacter didelphidarum TaxID=2040648 RepID=A0A3D8IN25_9HELI|nr:3-oxoacyl-[acyl-carrier-protein] synthase III C-terminal domain-containing protein [Helicobacter didelphidarum]RDU66513.1 beta-ketoacyl-ACP synthase III [Helicobacter didelphidarum]